MSNNNGFTILIVVFIILISMVTATVAIAMYFESQRSYNELTKEINNTSEIIIEECSISMETTRFLNYNISQTIYAIPMWEDFLREQQPKRIIELGTASGGFSLYLYMSALNLNADFETYDINPPVSLPVMEVLPFKKTFFQLDIFKNIKNIGGNINQPGQTILFCDNGKKIEEFKALAPFLKIGDIIGAHDWNTEIKDTDVQETIDKFNLHHLPVRYETEAHTKFFIKK